MLTVEDLPHLRERRTGVPKPQRAEEVLAQFLGLKVMRDDRGEVLSGVHEVSLRDVA